MIHRTKFYLMFGPFYVRVPASVWVLFPARQESGGGK